MTVRGYTPLSRVKYTRTAQVQKGVVDFESIVSTNDTIPISEYTAIAGAMLRNKSDNTVVTCTVATNIITVTQATLTDEPVVGSAYET
ncbi:hypothetical protein MUP05_07755 [Candidatus Bathyarchaeota archaeon]|nr:hypothetical protein [Candidatus Bathyarchaeota archaeon]